MIKNAIPLRDFKGFLLVHKVTIAIALISLATSIFLVGCTTSYALEKQNDLSVKPSAVMAKPTISPVDTLPPAPKNYPIGSPPTISAQAAIVMNPMNKEVLFEKDAYSRRAVASTQKLLTAIVALERANGKIVKVPVEATKLEPSKLYLRAGAEYPVNTLLKALLVKSANDVAYTIAHGAGGSFQGFVNMMNMKAAQIGMQNSHFKNASGLTLEGQYSTAYDIALCASLAYQNPYIRDYVKTKNMTFNYADGRTKELNNTNELLKRIPYCTGMKTGTTRASGYCLVSSGELNGQIMIVGVFGASSKSVLWKESEALLKWALER